MKKSAFMVRMSNEGYHEIAMSRGLVVIGWSALDDLRCCDAQSKQERIEKIKAVLRKSEWYKNESAVRSVAGTLHRFIYEIKHGDYIIYPRYKGFHIGEVDADGLHKANYNEDLRLKDCAWNWKVTWRKNSTGHPLLVPRGYTEATIVSALKYQGTCLRFDDTLIPGIDKAIARKTPLTASMLLREDSEFLEKVVTAMQKALDPDKLEQLVERLLKKQGAEVNRFCHGVRGKKGDVDLEAIFHNSYCGSAREADQVTYAYQVKHHFGKSNHEAISQLVDRFKDIGSTKEDTTKYKRGVAITTGEFDQEAVKLQGEFNSNQGEHEVEIVLLNGRDLALWVIESGLAGIEEYE